MTIIILGAILLLGAVVRLYDLTERTITHIEIYVPGIELPPDISAPPSRFTVKETLISLLEEQEPHPPGYYLFMLYWTKLFGSSILALRLPSVLFGVGSIFLIFILGVLEKDSIPALVAAAMLALNGWHMLWSQLAKNYSMSCFLGLMSTVLILLLSRESGRRLILQFLYLSITVAGLASTIWFWPIFVTHILWVVRTNWTSRTIPEVLRLQFAVFNLGSPMLSLAIFQSRRPSYLNLNPLEELGQYLQFGSLFERDHFVTPPGTIPVYAQILLVAIGLLLFWFGLAVDGRPDMKREYLNECAQSSTIVFLTGAFAFLFILRLAKFTYGFDANQTLLVVASSVIPILIIVIYFLLRRHWRSLQEFVASQSKRPYPWLISVMAGVVVLTIALVADGFGIVGKAVIGDYQIRFLLSGSVILLVGVLVSPLTRRYVHIPYSLNSFLAILPVAMLVVSLPIAPLLVSRGLLLYEPYLFLVLSKGLDLLIQRNRFWIIIAMVVAVIFLLSILYFKDGHHEHPTDYKTLAEQWIPEIQESDLIFIRRHDGITTPIFYYIQANRYHFVDNDYIEETLESPGSRVWFLYARGHEMTQEMEEALKEYQILDKVNAFRIQALLFSRQTDS